MGLPHPRMAMPTWHTDRSANMKGQSLAHSSACRSFQDRVTLHDQAERNTQRCRLQRREYVESDRRRDQPKCKARETGDKRPGECSNEKDCQIKGKQIHALAPR